MDPGYLGWVAQSDCVIEEIVARSTGVSTRRSTPPRSVTSGSRYPHSPDSDAIADYLDPETARIDALLTKRRMAAVSKSAGRGSWSQRFGTCLSSRGRDVSKYACREVVVGIVITPSAWNAETGVPAIRGLNVTAGRISSEDLVYLTPEGDQLHPKSRFKAGDVVIVRTGQAGAAAAVPPALDGANCIDLLLSGRRIVGPPVFGDGSELRLDAEARG